MATARAGEDEGDEVVHPLRDSCGTGGGGGASTTGPRPQRSPNGAATVEVRFCAPSSGAGARALDGSGLGFSMAGVLGGGICAGGLVSRGCGAEVLGRGDDVDGAAGEGGFDVVFLVGEGEGYGGLSEVGDVVVMAGVVMGVLRNGVVGCIGGCVAGGFGGLFRLFRTTQGMSDGVDFWLVYAVR